MRVHVLLNLLNELGKAIKFEACRAFCFFTSRLIKFIKTKAQFLILFII